MKRIVWRHRFSWLAAVVVTGLAVLILARAIADAKRPAAESSKPQLPVQVAQVNRQWPGNVNIVQTVPANAFLKRDFGKGMIEFPTEQLLAAQTVPAAAPPPAAFVNPKVEPGKVHWNNDFATACAAAKKSGKPVLLFQMMGKLDERFC